MLPLNQQMSKRKTTALEQQLADLTSIIGEPAAKKRMAEIIVERRLDALLRLNLCTHPSDRPHTP